MSRKKQIEREKPDPVAEAAFLKQLAEQPRQEKREAVAAAKNKLQPAVEAAEAAVDEVQALAREHGAFVLSAEQAVDVATLVLACGLPANEVHNLHRRIEDAAVAPGNARMALDRLRQQIRHLDHGDLNGRTIPTIAFELRALTFVPASYREGVAAIRAGMLGFAERLRRRGAGAAIVARLVEIRHPEPRVDSPRVETEFDVFDREVR